MDTCIRRYVVFVIHLPLSQLSVLGTAKYDSKYIKRYVYSVPDDSRPFHD